MLNPELAPVAVAVLAALCVTALVASLLYRRIARPTPAQQRLRTLMQPLGSGDGQSANADEQRRRKLVETTLRELDDKQKAKRAAKPTLLLRMRQAGLRWSRQTYALVCVGAAGASFLILKLFGTGFLTSFGFAVAGGLLLPHLYVNGCRKRRFNRFTAEFPNSVDVIVRGVKSGLPLVDCLRIIAAESQEPVRGEFRTIIEDQTLGIPLDESVQRLTERMPLAEASFFAIVIAIQSRTGGSLSEALGSLSKVLRDRKKMKAKIKAVSSEAKASAGIIGSLPFLVGALLHVINPDYLTVLFTTMIGHILLTACAIWMTMGILMMRKMINFDF